MESRKKCTKCGEEKPATNEFFHKNRKTPDGFEYWCKLCKAARSIYYRKKKLKEIDMVAEKKDRMKSGAGNGRRKKSRSSNPDPAGGPPPAPMITDGITLPPEIIRALKKSIGRTIVTEFEKFIEEKYA